MPFVPKLKPACARWSLLSASVMLGLMPVAASAADSAANNTMAAQMQTLLDRMQQLEARNKSLEKRVEELSKGAAPLASSAAPANATPAAASSSANDTRLQTVERKTQALAQQVQALARPLVPDFEGGDDGPQFDLGLVGVFQHVNRKGGESGSAGRFSFRGDVGVTLPAGAIGSANSTLVGQIRFGQGGGVALRPTFTGAVNSTTFEAGAGSQETYAVVAQAYYQLDLPLDNGRLNDQLGTRAELTVGKLDLFAFFDQNTAADDESVAFLNNVFVHNPLLDSGGDIGADSFGFAPGVRAAYVHESDDYSIGASLGVFAAGGDGSQFNGSAGKPLVIAQVDFAPKQINGEARGNYRLYAWTNGRTTEFDDSTLQRHSGFGLSVDQRLGAEWNLFGRYGQRTVGHGPFDRALTFGVEHGGRLWGRHRDAVGIAFASLDASSAWRRATGADPALVGFRSSGQESVAEVYYRLTVHDQLAISPDFQWIRRPGGDGRAPNVAVFGLRATLGF